MNRRTLATVWTAVNVTLLVVAFGLLVATLDVEWTGWGLRGGNLASEVIIVTLGLLLTIRRPANPIGWLVLATMTHFALDEVGTYLDLWLIEQGRALTGPLAGLFEAAWVPGMVLVLHAFARFPDGELPDGLRGRAVMVLGPLAVVTVSVAMFSDAHLGVETAASADRASGAGPLFLPLALYALSVLATVVTRFRRSTGVRRQQFRWVTFGAVPLVVGFVMTPLVATSPRLLDIAALLGAVGMTLVFAAFGVAILRYRLYDLDRIVSRTISYTVLTGAVAAVWAGVAVVPPLLLGAEAGVSNTTVAVATLAAMALANPLRRRIQEGIDRRLYRSRYDARRAVEELGTSLAAEVDSHTMHQRLVGTLATTLRPGTVAVWTPDVRSGVGDG